MNIRYLILGLVAVFIFSCENGNKSSVEKNCSSVVVERYGNQEGFTIINIKTDKASEVKLVLGKHNNETETIVSVNFVTDSLKDQYCTCLMREDGSFIITADEIQYD